jgi:hypothetical protein
MRAASIPTFALAVLHTACATTGTQHTEYLPAHPTTGVAPVFALMAEPTSETILASTLPGVIVVGWSDGLVVFSHDRLSGGPPFATKHIDRDTVSRVRSTAWNALSPLKLRGFGAFDAQSTSAFVAGPDYSQRVYSSLELAPNSTSVGTAGQVADFDAFRVGWRRAADAMRSVMDATTPLSDHEPVRFQQVVVSPVR